MNSKSLHLPQHALSTRILFGAPGDFLDRHQGLALAVVVILILVGSAP